MTLFFLLAGLEIKRQLVTGELRDRRAAALPAIAALGGMVVPALIYTLLNAGHPGSGGWGIPVATDIAFAVGVVTLAGSRVPLGARIFILTLAVVDDVGGIIVIAVFYAEDVRLAWLGLAALAVLATVVLRRLEIRSIVPYVVLGAVCWYSLRRCGVEAAIAGVVFGLLTPTRPFHDPADFGDVTHGLVDRIETATRWRPRIWPGTRGDGVAAGAHREPPQPLGGVRHRAAVRAGQRRRPPRCRGARRAGHARGHRRAGARQDGGCVRRGLARGPPRRRPPARVRTWRHMLGLAVTAGIGFTVALFVTGLSFDDPALTSSAKIGILVASAAAGGAGFVLLRAVPRRATWRGPRSRAGGRSHSTARRLMVQDRYRPRPWAQILTYSTCRCSTGRRRRRDGGSWRGPGGPGCSWSRRGVRRPRAGTFSRTRCGHRSG